MAKQRNMHHHNAIYFGICNHSSQLHGQYFKCVKWNEIIYDSHLFACPILYGVNSRTMFAEALNQIFAAKKWLEPTMENFIVHTLAISNWFLPHSRTFNGDPIDEDNWASIWSLQIYGARFNWINRSEKPFHLSIECTGDTLDSNSLMIAALARHW